MWILDVLEVVRASMGIVFIGCVVVYHIHKQR